MKVGFEEQRNTERSILMNSRGFWFTLVRVTGRWPDLINRALKCRSPTGHML